MQRRGSLVHKIGTQAVFCLNLPVHPGIMQSIFDGPGDNECTADVVYFIRRSGKHQMTDELSDSGSTAEPSGGEMPLPYVVAMVLCNTITLELGSNSITLHGCFSAISAMSFPAVHPRMAVYVALTNGRGNVPFRLSLVHSEGDIRPVFEVQGTIPFPDPLATVELRFPIPPVSFAQPGVYFLQMHVSNQFLMERRLLVMQVGGEDGESRI